MTTTERHDIYEQQIRNAAERATLAESVERDRETQRQVNEVLTKRVLELEKRIDALEGKRRKVA